MGCSPWIQPIDSQPQNLFAPGVDLSKLPRQNITPCVGCGAAIDCLSGNIWQYSLTAPPTYPFFYACPSGNCNPLFVEYQCCKVILQYPKPANPTAAQMSAILAQLVLDCKNLNPPCPTDTTPTTPINPVQIIGLPCPQIIVTTTDDTLPGFSVGVPYSYQLQSVGGSGYTTWAITAGGLPDGVTMDSGGYISGTPTDDGDGTFTVQVNEVPRIGCPPATATLSYSVYTVTLTVSPGYNFTYEGVNYYIMEPNASLTFTVTVKDQDDIPGSGTVTLTGDVTGTVTLNDSGMGIITGPAPGTTGFYSVTATFNDGDATATIDLAVLDTNPITIGGGILGYANAQGISSPTPLNYTAGSVYMGASIWKNTTTQVTAQFGRTVATGLVTIGSATWNGNCTLLSLAGSYSGGPAGYTTGTLTQP